MKNPVPHETPRAELKWLRPNDVALRLGVTRETARKILRRIPGAMRMYDTADGRRQVWRVLAEDFAAWQASERVTAEQLAAQVRTIEAEQESLDVVYFVQALAEPFGPVKIGTTRRMKMQDRLRGIQTGNPKKLGVLAVIAGDAREERKLHLQFAASRLEGEWFAWTPELGSFVAAALPKRRTG